MAALTRVRHFLLPVLLAAVACAVLVAGWRLMWFLTDDAYITFRYVGNSMLGHGYVWNPPPFLPVEGYTSFLWIVLLDGVWRLTGVEPPAAANVLSLVFTGATVVLATAWVWRLGWSDRLRPRRWLLTALVLIGLVTNRIFVTWSSSGLETAMFNFFVLVWLYLATHIPAAARFRLLFLSAAASLTALTRPDGLLYAAATVGLAGLMWLEQGRRTGLRGIASLLPLLAVPVHLVWRRIFYGAWLPNTYHAKTADAWPEAGLRYLASFVLEHALWIWLAVVAAGAVTTWRARRVRSLAAVPSVAVATVALHVGYYTLVVGGDHFEYRVYSYLVLPLLLIYAVTLDRLRAPPFVAAAALTGFIVASGVLPWTHFAATRHLSTRQETHQLRMPLADRFPAVLGWYVRSFDGLQNWLVGHYVCCRHQEHKVAAADWLANVVPPRTEGTQEVASAYPVMAYWGGIGGLAWALPHVNFIDLFGLSDRVIARSEFADKEFRRMAHDRIAPEDYVNAFRPNVVLEPGRRVTILPRARELTAEEIMAIERRWSKD
ncbi:MAG: hypothetical protein GY838_05065 [bacterium]|nr:hypothetical protein [bacterium]